MKRLQRQISESTRVQNKRDEAETRWSGAETAWDAVTLVLAYDPEIGEPLNEAGTLRTFVLQGARSNDMPDIVVIYEDRNPTIEVIDVKYKDAGQYVRQVH
ncbi:MAG: hypothetical protein AAF590_09055 [Pseudomonadota bacterium]